MRTVEEVAAQMSGAKVFSVLDAKSSFWQIRLNKKSSMLTTFSTLFGRYRFLRRPFGISSASEVFQRSMEQLFAGYPCSVIVDDIIIGGRGVAEHDANLKKVLERVREVNLKLNPATCKFRLDHVGYVGHIFTSEGLKADPSETDAITNMPVPTDVVSPQRFLCMVNYLGKFIPNFSDIAAPLRKENSSTRTLHGVGSSSIRMHLTFLDHAYQVHLSCHTMMSKDQSRSPVMRHATDLEQRACKMAGQ